MDESIRLQLEFTAALIYQRLRSGDFATVRSLFKSTEVEYYSFLDGIVTFNLDTDLYKCKSLKDDYLFEKLSSLAGMYRTIYDECLEYVKEVRRISRLTGYEKYAAECVLHGISDKALTYREWLEANANSANDEENDTQLEQLVR